MKVPPAASYKTRLGRRLAIVLYFPLLIVLALFYGLGNGVLLLMQNAEDAWEVWRR